MLKHIVLWKFKDSAEGKSKAENVALVKARLEALAPVIPEIHAITLGADLGRIPSNCDLALLVDTENAETLSIYAGHPEHLKVMDYIKKVVESRTALDFEW